ncbi:hypothetical protein [Aestuariivirga sp.]|uniref:hypothetical protein n=1 Tax=Aestuariivirga sp. TaxID=2650926 RepID=UPI0039E3458D
MLKHIVSLAGTGLIALMLAGPAHALTQAECSTKYQAAKEANKLKGMSWNDFRKAQCGDDAAAAPAATTKTTKPAAGDADAASLSPAQCSAKYQKAKDADALQGATWNEFRKDQCGPGASVAFTPPKKAKAANTKADDGKALPMAACSEKYQAAKANNTLKGKTWNEFRKASCGAGADDDDSVPSMDEASYTNDPDVPVTKAPRGVTFPKVVSRKFSSETPGKQRLHTCLASYYDNKDANTLNGLKWIQKGGGYYSLCNQRLKAAGA